MKGAKCDRLEGCQEGSFGYRGLHKLNLKGKKDSLFPQLFTFEVKEPLLLMTNGWNV